MDNSPVVFLHNQDRVNEFAEDVYLRYGIAKVTTGDYTVHSLSLSAFASISVWLVDKCVNAQQPSVYMILGAPNSWLIALQCLAQRFGAYLERRNEPIPSIVRLADSRKKSLPQWALQTDRPFTGNPIPSSILVGDTLSGKAVTPWPFHLPGGSSEWLHRAVDNISSVAFVNASDLGHNDTFDQLLSSAMAWNLKPPRIFALGKSAREQLWSYGLAPTKTLVHPSWARRFRHKEWESYWGAFQQALFDGYVNERWLVK